MKTKKEITESTVIITTPTMYASGEYQIEIDGLYYSNYEIEGNKITSFPSENYDTSLNLYNETAKTKKEFVNAIKRIID